MEICDFWMITPAFGGTVKTEVESIIGWDSVDADETNGYDNSDDSRCLN